MSRHSLFAGSLLLAFALLATAGAAEPQTTEEKLSGKELVEQLGDNSYAKREAAREELVRRETAVEKEIKEGLKSDELEVRYQCEQLLIDIVERIRQRQFDQFVKDADADPKKEYDFPSWPKLQKVTGDSKAARELYIEMYRAESDTLKILEGKKEPIAAHVEYRARFFQRRTPGLYQVQVGIGNIGALMLAAGDEEAGVTSAGKSALYSLCTQQVFRDAMQSKDAPIRKVFKHYAASTDDMAAYQCMMLTQQIGMPEESVDCAARLMKSKSAPAHYRYMAAQSLAKSGDEKHIPLFATSLEDATMITQSSVSIAGKPGGGVTQKIFATQMRDISLYSIIHLSKQDPKKFGFDRATPISGSSNMIVNISSIGFENDDTRKIAFDSWKKYQDEQKSKLAEDEKKKK